MTQWWPREFSWSQEGLEEMGIEPRATDVTLEHRGWERHGDGAKEYRDGLEAAGAWPHALARFAAATGTRSARS